MHIGCNVLGEPKTVDILQKPSKSSGRGSIDAQNSLIPSLIEELAKNRRTSREQSAMAAKGCLTHDLC